MTRSFTPEAADAIQSAAARAFQGGGHPIPTSSVLTSAAELLTSLWDAARDRGIEPGDFDNLYGNITSTVLEAQIQAFNRQNPDDVDPLALVAEAVRVTAERTEQPIEICDGPTATSATNAYAVIRRLPQTPAWGRYGDANLAVTLRREAWSATTFGPWEWSLFPDQPGGTPDHATVIAPPLSLQAAAEVAVIIGQVLTGELRAW